MVMVDIYLNYREPPKAPFLSIPKSDVERLSNCPFRWLRYVMFSVCGAYGDLFETLGANDPVDYNASLTDPPTTIYYKPSGECMFVDHEGLNDRFTSTTLTTGRENFREAILQRDGTCVITDEDADDCDAAHLIPRSKGDEYIAKVIQLRSRLYSSPPSISGINDGQNGLLLSKTLHSRLGRGVVAFIQTPNYGLEPSDIKRVDLGPARRDHITLQQLVELEGANSNRLEWFLGTIESEPSPGDLNAAFGYGAHLDVQFRGPAPLSLPPPPTLILDYVYGVATYNLWGSIQDGGHAIMKDYRNANYASIPPLPQQDVDDSNNDALERTCDRSDDRREDPDYSPHRSTRRGDVMARAMDRLNLYFMSLHGITPEEAAARREKRMEEEELKAQEASRSKVIEWMKATPVDG